MRILQVGLLLILLGCSTIGPSQDATPTPELTMESPCASINSGRSPSALFDTSRIKDFFSCSVAAKGEEKQLPATPTPAFEEQLVTDFATQSRLIGLKNSMAADGTLQSPISIGQRIEKWRKAILPIFKLGFQESEGFTRAMEAELRDLSTRYKRTLAAKAAEGKFDEYDYVIVGGGVHGTIALAKILRDQPNARVLVIESSETLGSTFRLLSDIFKINSSSRPSGPNSRPLPGEGNLNELPELAFQVSELSQGKYPTSGDLGRALVAGGYSVMESYPNVRVLLTSEVRKIDQQSDSDPLNLTVKFKVGTEDVTTTISAPNVVIASGLGLPSYPPKFIEFLKQNPQVLQSPDLRKQLPKVVTFEDLLKIIAKSDNPKKFFANKKIDILGTGDSANVLIEFLLGYAPDNAYGKSDGQTALAKALRWISQTAETCEQFIRTARSRYVQIGTGFRSSSPNSPAMLRGVPQKADSLFFDDQNRLSIKLDDGSVISDSDLIVVATGFEGQLHKLLASLYPGFESDRDLLDQLPFVEAKTSVSGEEKTRVARSVPVRGRNSLIIVGPGGGQLAQKNELFGIIQNFVSIFNNAPRTVAAVAKQVANYVLPNRNVASADLLLKLPDARGANELLVKGIQSGRSLGTSSQAYLASCFNSFFKNVSSVSSRETLFKMEFNYIPESGDLFIRSPDRPDIRMLVESMDAAQDFFPEIQALLKPYAGKYRLEIEVPIKDGIFHYAEARARFPNGEPILLGNGVATFQSKPLVLRGLDQSNIAQLRQKISAIDATKATIRTGDTVYFRYRKAKVTGIDPSGGYALQFEDGSTDYQIARGNLAVVGNFNGISTGDTVYLNTRKAKVVGIRPDGTYTIQFDGGATDYAITRASLATMSGSNGISAGEIAYYNKERVLILGTRPDKTFTIQMANGSIDYAIRLESLYVKGNSKGISTGELVYFNGRQVMVVGINSEGRFAIMQEDRGAIETGIPAASLSTKLGN